MKSSQKDLIDLLPFGVAVICSDLALKLVNKKFAEITELKVGDSLSVSESKFATTEVIMNIKRVFETGDESMQYIPGLSNEAKNEYQVATLIPLFGDNSDVHEILIILHSTSESGNWQKEFNMLFEKVPCYISIVDKNLNVLRANERYRDTFGDVHSIFNTEQAKKRGYEYMSSPTVLAFTEGIEQIGSQVGITKSGEKAHLMISSIPLSRNDEGIYHVIEIAADITELNQLQEQLHHAHDFYSDLIESSADGIVALTHKGKVQIFNSAAREMLKWNQPRKPGIPKIQEMLPSEFFGDYDEDGRIINDVEYVLKASDGSEVPVKMNAFIIRTKKNVMGRVAFMQDLRKIKNLENEKKKLEQEAVATTFISLENNIELLLSEQEKYLDAYGELRNKAKKEELDKAWMILRKKFELKNRIVQTFIDFAKGYQPKIELINLAEVVNNVVDEFRDLAISQQVHMNLNSAGDLSGIRIDKYAISSLLIILVSNAIDSASAQGSNGRLEIAVGCIDNKLIIEIVDNGPIVPQKTLDNYFKIEDSRETKMGMLTASMISNIIGGSIIARSDSKIGNSFRVEMPLIK